MRRSIIKRTPPSEDGSNKNNAKTVYIPVPNLHFGNVWRICGLLLTLVSLLYSRYCLGVSLEIVEGFAIVTVAIE
jgi:hypothetical protein